MALLRRPSLPQEAKACRISDSAGQPIAASAHGQDVAGTRVVWLHFAAQAAQDQLTPTEFLAILLDDQLERRDQTRLRRRLVEAGVEPPKTLAQFDFSAVPQLNRTLVLDLSTCGFVARAQNVLLSGVANALAIEALKRGHTVLVRSVHRLEVIARVVEIPFHDVR